jgi:hypothetical protein
MGERRGKWMEVVQEFDLDIKPIKLVKGQGLCKLSIEAQDQVNEESGWENELALLCSEYLYVPPRARFLVWETHLSLASQYLPRKSKT